jgi:hypothetical protein
MFTNNTSSGEMFRGSEFLSNQGKKFKGAFKSYLGTNVHKAGMKMGGELFGVGTQGIGRVLGPAMALYAGYEGYKEGGITGAAWGVGKEYASWYAFGALSKVINPAIGYTLAGAGAAAAVGLGFHYGSGGTTAGLFRPWVNAYARKHAKMEMATPVVDQFGTIGTMRQRSLQAIQNSRLNGRTALGNEASLMYRPYSM